MFLKIFLIIMLYPLLPLFYFLLRNEIKPQKNIVLETLKIFPFRAVKPLLHPEKIKLPGKTVSVKLL